MISRVRPSGTAKLTAAMYFLKQMIQIHITNSLFLGLLSDPCTAKTLRYCEMKIHILLSSDLKSCMICTITNEHSPVSAVRMHGGVWGVKVLNSCPHSHVGHENQTGLTLIFLHVENILDICCVLNHACILPATEWAGMSKEPAFGIWVVVKQFWGLWISVKAHDVWGFLVC